MPAMPYSNVTPDDLFKCRQCGDCCKGYGGTYVTADDIKAISGYIGISPDELVKEFCTFSGSKPLLTQKADGYCIFWDKICTIHPVKPRMCKAWPFIPPVLADPFNWNIMAGSCPGIQTGYPPEIVTFIVARMIRETAMREVGERP
jgi:uncharacterized protein